MPVYYHADGTPSPNPTSLAAAKETRSKRYDDLQKCNVCIQRSAILPGNNCSIKYSKNSKCIHCARLEAQVFYNRMVGANREEPPYTPVTDEMLEAAEMFPHDHPAPDTPQAAAALGLDKYVHPDACATHGHIGVRMLSDGQCWFCKQESIRRRDPARAQAKKLHETWYTPTLPCEECGQIALRNTRTNACRGCNPLPTDTPSPRKAASLAGLKWYIPDEPCKHCGLTALKRVNNGQCQGCMPPANARTLDNASRTLIDSMPDLIMTRWDALIGGFKVYRIDDSGYRYVTTGEKVTLD